MTKTGTEQAATRRVVYTIISAPREEGDGYLQVELDFAEAERTYTRLLRGDKTSRYNLYATLLDSDEDRHVPASFDDFWSLVDFMYDVFDHTVRPLPVVLFKERPMIWGNESRTAKVKADHKRFKDALNSLDSFEGTQQEKEFRAFELAFAL